MASKSKIKGNYHENYFVKLFSKLGFNVRKQPLSGVLQEYPADIDGGGLGDPALRTQLEAFSRRVLRFRSTVTLLGDPIFFNLIEWKT